MLQKKHIPTYLTLVRCLGVPVVAGLLVYSEQRGSLAAWAGGLFLFFAATDFLDGYLARKWKVESALGAMLDTMADKLLVLVPLCVLVSQQVVGPLLLALLIGRDIYMSNLRAAAAFEGVLIVARSVGKYKTALQMLALPAICLGAAYARDGGAMWLAVGRLGVWALWLSVGLALWSAMEYSVSYYRGAKRAA